MARVGRRVLCWVLAASMACSPLWVYAQQSAAAGAAAGTKKPDLSYVTPDAVVAAVAHPQRVLSAPEMEMLPIEVLSAAGKKELGIDPLDIEQVMVIVEPPTAGPPGFGAVVRFSKPYQLEGILEPLAADTVEAELEGKTYRQGQGPMAPSLYMPDDRTLLVAQDFLLRKMLANRKAPAEGPLAKLMTATDVSGDLVVVAVVDPVRDLITAQLAQAPLPPPLEGLKKLPDLLTAAKIEVNATRGIGVALVLLAPDEAKAEELEALINQLLDLAQQMFLAQVAKEVSGDDPVEEAMMQYMQRINQKMFDALRPVRTGKMVRLSQGGQQYSQVAVVGILIALLLPAVQAAREAARRTQSMNNLKEIGLGMFNYHDAHRQFPARASFDASGKPLLSWRVHILPFIEQQALYEQFHLDEPWDSEHNKQLIPMMPPVYHNPSSKPEPGKASYLVPVGGGTIFEAEKGVPLAGIKDGSANTILALEVNPEEAVIWTKPDDWQYDPSQPLSGLGRAHPGGFLALFADGHVSFLSQAIDPEVFGRLLMMADGQPVGNF